MDLSSLTITFAQTSLDSASQVAAAHTDPALCRGWQVVACTVLCSALAQLTKLVTKLFRTGKLDLRVLAKTGGMPSSHAAGAAALATSVGLEYGFNSPLFAVAATFAMVTMFDAQGVRRATGSQASILNKIMDDLLERPDRRKTA